MASAPDVLKIKRRRTGATGAPAALENGEIAFNEVNNTLYYGKGDDGSGMATSVIPVVGEAAFLMPANNLSDVQSKPASFDNIKQPAALNYQGAMSVATDVQIYQSAIGPYAITPGAIDTASAWVGIAEQPIISINWTGGINFMVNSIGGNVEIGNPSNGKPGTYRLLYLGGADLNVKTVTFGSNFKGDLPTINDMTVATHYLLTIFCVSATHFLATAVRAQ